MSVKTQAEVSQIRDRDEQLFLNLENSWGQVMVHSHVHDCVAAVLRDGDNITFGMFASREHLVKHAQLTGKAILWDSEGEDW